MRTENDIRAAFGSLESDAPSVDDVLAGLQRRSPQSHTAHRRLWVSVGAAATVAAVIAIVAVASGHRHTVQPAGPTTSTAAVSCRTGTSVLLSSVAEAAEVHALQARASAVGLRHATVSAAGGVFRVQARSASAAQLGGLCASTPVDFRPVVVAVAASPSAHGGDSDPLGRLGFPVPVTDAAYERLSTTQQSALTTALATYDCSSVPADVPGKPEVACDKAGAVYLLAPAVLSGSDVTSASAVAPNVSTGTAEWTVSLELTPAGQAAWAGYTGAHNIGGPAGQSNTDVLSCGATTTPCADFVGFLVGGTVLSAPVNEEAIDGGATQVAGGFTQATATTLAAQLSSQLPVPLTVGP